MTASPLPATAPARLVPDFAHLAAAAHWHKSISAQLRQAIKTGQPERVWTAWAEYLRRREEPPPLARLIGSSTWPLTWAMPEELADRGTPSLLDRLRSLEGSEGDRPVFVPRGSGRSPERKPRPSPAVLSWDEEAADWIADASFDGLAVVRPLEALAWTHALPRLASDLSPEVWWRLLGHLCDLAVEACWLVPEEAPLVHALAAGELPLTLAYVFPEVTACRRLLGPARRAISASLIDVPDGAGLVHAARWDLMRPLLACWTRCRAMGGQERPSCMTALAVAQYEWAVNQVLRWARPDGSQVLAEGPAAAWCEDLFRAALRLDSDLSDRDLAEAVLPGGKWGGSRPPALPPPAMHSEWAAAAVLRSGWNRRQPCLSVLYPNGSVLVELVCHGEVLWSGRWECEVRRDGRLLAPEGDWEEVCWVSDEDVDYLELEIALAEGLLVQRQMILAHQDRLLLLADSILGDEPGRIEYRGRLPLGPGVEFRPAAETREGFLVGRRPVATVFPLALGEWRADGQGGSLHQTPEGLEMHQAIEGRSLCGPLLFDLDPRRFGRPFTWRRLTVAESLSVVGDDVAVARRVQIGRQQWVFYRSLALAANRTFLGHNLATETLLARFTCAGEVQSLVEVV